MMSWSSNDTMIILMPLVVLFLGIIISSEQVHKEDSLQTALTFVVRVHSVTILCAYSYLIMNVTLGLKEYTIIRISTVVVFMAIVFMTQYNCIRFFQDDKYNDLSEVIYFWGLIISPINMLVFYLLKSIMLKFEFVCDFLDIDYEDSITLVYESYGLIIGTIIYIVVEFFIRKQNLGMKIVSYTYLFSIIGLILPVLNKSFSKVIYELI